LLPRGQRRSTCKSVIGLTCFARIVFRLTLLRLTLFRKGHPTLPPNRCRGDLAAWQLRNLRPLPLGNRPGSRKVPMGSVEVGWSSRIPTQSLPFDKSRGSQLFHWPVVCESVAVLTVSRIFCARSEKGKAENGCRTRHWWVTLCETPVRRLTNSRPF
jgi:hypothetical protein